MQRMTPDQALRVFDRMAPGFYQMIGDRANRPFDRKIRSVQRLQDISAVTGECSWLNTNYFTHPITQVDRPSTMLIREFDRAHQGLDVPDEWQQHGFTHYARIEFFPVHIRPHAMDRWRQRSYDRRPGTVNALEYDIAKIFSNEFMLRGAPASKWCGLPVDDGIFLGEWLMLAELEQQGIQDFMPTRQVNVMWKHNSRKNKTYLCDQWDYADSDHMFIANTFISWSDCSFNQAKLGKQYLEDPETMAQKFRRDGHADEWQPSKNSNITKNTPPKSMN